MLMVGAALEHRIRPERESGCAMLHLVAAEFDHELGIDGTTDRFGIQPFRTAKAIVRIQPEKAEW